jgi:PTH1 family peptidyl-tRNA hydrolase
MALVVGLGNPGPKYAGTRHNVGFMVVDRAAGRCRGKFTEQRYRADVARTARKSGPLVFVKPRTFMNDSGNAVGPAAAELCLPDLSDLLIVLDDVHLEFGRLRLRPGGSDGGHNGLASVIARMGTVRVPRLRVGIGGGEAYDRVDYVLDEFTDDEQDRLPEVIDRASDAVLAWFHQGINAAMNEVNVFLSEEEPES